MKRAILFAGGIVLSVACLWLVLRKQNFGDLAEAARNIRWQWVAANLTVFYLGFYLRAVRWRCFFPAEMKISGSRLFGPMMLGYTLNSLFPFRLGEPGRAVVAGRRERVPITMALASVVAERAVDIVILLGTMALVFATVPFAEFHSSITVKGREISLDLDFLRGFVRNTSALALLLAVGILLMMSRRCRALVGRVIKGAKFLPPAFAHKVVHLIELFARGFEGLRSPLTALWIAIHSILIWGSAAWSIQLMGPAFGVSLTLLQATALMVIICVAITLPATPGYWGLYEAGFVFGARLLGLQASSAALAAMALLLHLAQYIPIVIYGVIWAAANGLSLREAAHAAEVVEAAESAAE